MAVPVYPSLTVSAESVAPVRVTVNVDVPPSITVFDERVIVTVGKFDDVEYRYFCGMCSGSKAVFSQNRLAL